ncbi:hypothetical protein EG327_010086 [Venturia inaequalis]|uniref:Heterokaryon incompatibility domain-containing protein n=1 Tax=Venturia inaequalis TaxID=5025 RepID=A0A8H3VSY9_VENIN|nr:hypothetical protein EG327_010086 [Venturia inaequalis]
MRLINVTSMKLEQFFDDSQIPPYAILSHRWGVNELTLQEYQKVLVKRHPGYEKIKQFCLKVMELGHIYAWIDTCCIDKTSSAELSESINSMFAWYRKAEICIVYLADVYIEDTRFRANFEPSVFAALNREHLASRSRVALEMARSDWFTRGWTLQELLAPRNVQFFDAAWQFFGTRTDLQDILAARTGIEEQFLVGSEMETASIAKRMSWAADRETSRIEDIAYCLLGIFGVNMPLLYGEGMRAFTRLQEEIMKDSADHSLFAWTAFDRTHNALNQDGMRGPLAVSPMEFRDARHVVPYPDLLGNAPYAMTNQGLRIDFPMYPYLERPGAWLAILDCYDGQLGRPLAVVIQQKNPRIVGSKQYGRLLQPPGPVAVVAEMLGEAETKTIYLKRGALTKASHDKQYTFNLRFMKTLGSNPVNVKISIISIHSFDDFDDLSAIQMQTDERSQWTASLASNSRDLGIRLATVFSSGMCLEFLMRIKISPPHAYLHELDRWMRTQCTSMIIGGDAGSLPWLNRLSTDEADSHKSKSLFEVGAMTKDFENGGPIFRFELVPHLQRIRIFEYMQDMPYKLPGKCHEIDGKPITQSHEVSEKDQYRIVQHCIDAYAGLRELYSHMLYVWDTDMPTWYEASCNEHHFAVHYHEWKCQRNVFGGVRRLIVADEIEAQYLFDDAGFAIPSEEGNNGQLEPNAEFGGRVGPSENNTSKQTALVGGIDGDNSLTDRTYITFGLEAGSDFETRCVLGD